MTAGPTDTELAKNYWKRTALSLRSQLEEKNPDMATRGKSGGIAEEYAQQYKEGVKIRGFERGLGDLNPERSDTQPKIDTGRLALSGQETVRELVKQGKSDEQIQAFLEKTSGYVDALALAGNDPTTTALLFNRVMNSSGNNQQLAYKDILEIIRMSQQLGPAHSRQNETAAIITALANYTAATKTNNSDSATIVQLYQQMSAQQQASFDRHLQLVRENAENRPSFADELAQIAGLQTTLGKLSGKEPPDVLMKRLEIEDKRAEREYNTKIEQGKEVRQGKWIEGAIGALSKLAESPLIREAGKKVAESLPGVGRVAGAVGQVQSSAARATLDQPLDEPFGFTCQQCGTAHRFSRKQLTLIESSPSRAWVCDHCGASYILKQQAGTDTAHPNKDDRRDESPGSF